MMNFQDHNGRNFEEEEDVESDELLSDDDEDGNGVSMLHDDAALKKNAEQEDEEEEEEESDEEYEEYQKFISTIFQDDLSDMSGTDADEDDEYSPDDAGNLLRMELDLDDEEADGEYFRVTRKEVQDLLDASMQTIAKNSSEHDAALSDSFHNQIRKLGDGKATDSNQAKSGVEDTSQPSSKNYDIQTQPNDGQTTEERFARFEKLEQVQKRNRLISTIVTKMFSGENEDSLVVDDMPIHNIRKLVARQMSIAVQLMIQMLLMSENLSDVDRQCSSKLMELSNLRSTALTKTYLITEQMESLKAYQSISKRCQEQLKAERPAYKNFAVEQKSRFLFDVAEDEEDEDDDYIDDDESPSQKRQCPFGHEDAEKGLKRARRQQMARTNQHMTRNRTANDPTLTKTSSSIFNIPTLSRVQLLLQAIDSARKYRDKMVHEYFNKRGQVGAQGAEKEEAGNVGTNGVQAAGGSIISGGGGNRRYLTDLKPPDRAIIFQLAAQQLELHIAPTFCVRLWKCLLPSHDYPLAPDFVESINPASLYGSTIFTPAEDDLLLRGIISVNSSEDKDAKSNGQWEKRVREKFLPSKEEQLLQYRQLQLSSGPEDSKFKRYRMLELEKQRHQKWSGNEDRELLRGYQVFGSKWFMIKLYFLPNKNRNEIKSRWTYLLKEWEKTFPRNALKSIIKCDGKLVKRMKKFLGSLAPREDGHSKAVSKTVETASKTEFVGPQYSSHNSESSINILSNHPSRASATEENMLQCSEDDALVESGMLTDSESESDNGANDEEEPVSQRDIQSLPGNVSLSSSQGPPSRGSNNITRNISQFHKQPILYRVPHPSVMYPAPGMALNNQYHSQFLQCGMIPGRSSDSIPGTTLVPQIPPSVHTHAPAMYAQPPEPCLMQQNPQYMRHHQGSELPNNVAPLDMLLAEKDAPLLLGKKKKKDDRKATKSDSVSKSVNTKDSLEISNSKKNRSVRFNQQYENSSQRSSSTEEKNNEPGFRLFDSVMSAANKIG